MSRLLVLKRKEATARESDALAKTNKTDPARIERVDKRGPNLMARRMKEALVNGFSERLG